MTLVLFRLACNCGVLESFSNVFCIQYVFCVIEMELLMEQRGVLPTA